MRVRFITAGGTIDKIYLRDSPGNSAVGSPFLDLLLPHLDLRIEYVVESLLRKDSADMTDLDRSLILGAIAISPERCIVVTHGTDTMIQTARALENVHGKCIVLTGAMRPGMYQNSDATFNVGVAVGAAISLPDGIYIAMHGRIFDPQRTLKDKSRGVFEVKAKGSV